MQIENWISRSVNRYWGKIIDHRNKEMRKALVELSKNYAQEGGQKKEEAVEAEKMEMEEELEYPLEISFK